MEIVEIANKIKNVGGNLYLVGGAVRDRFLNRNIKDEDYCVTGLSAKDFKTLFPEAFIKGKSFEVFEYDKKDFAMARKEEKEGSGHKGFVIKTGKYISIEEDLIRRDITINSMAQNVLTGEIIDPFNGVDDIKNKVIKATSKKFKEDPLRAYRIARFKAELEDFKIEEGTITLIKEMKEELYSLPKERIFIEFKRAMGCKKPSLFFDTLKKAEILDIHFKPIADLIGAIQPEKYHPEGDSYNHTMMVVDKSAELTEKTEIRYAALVHDLGKGATPKEQYPHHYNHEIIGEQIVIDFSKKLGVPVSWLKCGQVACREHMRGGIFARMKPSKKVDFIERVNKTYLGLHGLQIVVNCDMTRNDGKINIEGQFEDVGKKCIEEVTAQKIINRFGLHPGKELGKKLHEERVKWMTNNFNNV